MTNLIGSSIAVLLLLGCSSSHESAGSPDEEPIGLDEVDLSCGYTLSLDGGAGSEPEVLDLSSLDRDGVTVCLTLDSTPNLVSAHFAASTDWNTGTTSPFELALFDAGEVLLLEGWDVTVGQTDPRTFANLERSFPVGLVTQVELFVRSREVVSTQLALSLFEPFE